MAYNGSRPMALDTTGEPNSFGGKGIDDQLPLTGIPLCIGIECIRCSPCKFAGLVISVELAAGNNEVRLLSTRKCYVEGNMSFPHTERDLTQLLGGT